MPIKPPRLDDRNMMIFLRKQNYSTVRPEWTNFNNADPGMTVVQLFLMTN